MIFNENKYNTLWNHYIITKPYIHVNPFEAFQIYLRQNLFLNKYKIIQHFSYFLMPNAMALMQYLAENLTHYWMLVLYLCKQIFINFHHTFSRLVAYWPSQGCAKHMIFISIFIFKFSLLLLLNLSENNIFRIYRSSHSCKPPPWPAWQTDTPGTTEK